MLLARDLLSRVTALVESDTSLSLETAVRTAAATRHAELGHATLHVICSGSVLGKSKRRRASAGVSDGVAAESGSTMATGDDESAGVVQPLASAE